MSKRGREINRDIFTNVYSLIHPNDTHSSIELLNN